MEVNSTGIDCFRNIILLAISKATDKLIEKGYSRNVADTLKVLPEHNEDIEIGSCLGVISIGTDILKAYDSNMYAQNIICEMLVFVTASQNIDPTIYNENIIKKYISDVNRGNITAKWAQHNTLHARAVAVVELELDANTHPEWKHSDYTNWLLNDSKYRKLTKDRLRNDLAALFKKRGLDHLLGKAQHVKLKHQSRQ